MSLAISAGDIRKFDQIIQNYDWSIPYDSTWNDIQWNHNNTALVKQWNTTM